MKKVVGRHFCIGVAQLYLKSSSPLDFNSKMKIYCVLNNIVTGIYYCFFSVYKQHFSWKKKKVSSVNEIIQISLSLDLVKRALSPPPVPSPGISERLQGTFWNPTLYRLVLIEVFGFWSSSPHLIRKCPGQAGKSNSTSLESGNPNPLSWNFFKCK